MAINEFDTYVSPFRRPSLSFLGYDIAWSRGEGAYLYDDKGARYLDLCSGFAVFGFGRNNPRLISAAIESLQSCAPNLVQLDCPAGAGELAALLLAKAPPSLTRVAFCNSGTESIEAAIKFARRTTQRTKCVHCTGSFHGLSTGALSLNGDLPQFRDGFGQLLSNEAVPFNDIEALRKIVSAGDCAAFVVEAIQGKSMSTADDEYLRSAQELCERYGTLLVIDEVQSGLGRTGDMFACSRSGIQPDVMTLSKALSGGIVPIGACLHSERVHRAVFDSSTWWTHSSTFKENALAMAVGKAAILELDDGRYLERIQKLSAVFVEHLNGLKARHAAIKEIRGRGLMLGVILDGEPLDVMQNVISKMLKEHHVHIQPAGWLKITPAFTLSEEDISYFCSSLDLVLASWKPNHHPK